MKFAGAVFVLTGLFGLVVARKGDAEPAVTQLEEWATPYVPLFSTCRAVPPNDPGAQALFREMQEPADFAVLQKQLDALSSRPVEDLTAIDAEVFFLVLRQMLHQITVEDPTFAPQHVSRVMEGRKDGRRIIARFQEDSFVRCAQITSESWFMNNLRLRQRFSDKERASVRDEFMVFLERAVNGEARTDTFPADLHYTLGQLYLDKGFELLPSADRAAPLFEKGAVHLLDAAADPIEERYIDNWTRYAFMLEKLPLARQHKLAGQLLSHVEQTWGSKPDATARELRTYLHVLDLAGSVSLASKTGEDARTIYGKYLEIVQRLRQKQPRNPNLEVNLALGYRCLGDAHVMVHDAEAAGRAYRDASATFESASADAKEMLDFQDFRTSLTQRRNSLPASAR
jgi:hypothetical protein